jgi:FAD-linked sulfhydryl oxidase
MNLSTRKSNVPDLKELGRGSWTLLHTVSAKYPNAASKNEQEDMRKFLHGFAKFYPCDQCSVHMLAYMEQNPPDCRNRDTLQKWVCNLHNQVNNKLGKTLIDCKNVSSIHERWIGSKNEICNGNCK